MAAKSSGSKDLICDLMQEAVNGKVFPGGVLLVSRGREKFFFEAFGWSDPTTGEKATQETVYDLASLTKPLATTPAVMQLVKTGRLNLESAIGDILPTYRHTDKAFITPLQLLCHTSGLPDHRPYYIGLKGRTFQERKKEMEQLILETPLRSPPGRGTFYSDLGFMLLNQIIETVSGQRLDELVSREIYPPLGLDPAKDLFFVDLAAGVPEGVGFAATEFCPWRKRMIKGEVHDENAHAVGGIEGHAGLFGTARAVQELLSGMLDMLDGTLERPLFSPDLMAFFLREHGNTGRTPGFDKPSNEGSSAGKYFSKNTVGHLGFSGTSFWMDLDQRILVILLTNRIHPTRENTAIKTFRPLLHDTVMETFFGAGA